MTPGCICVQDCHNNYVIIHIFSLFLVTLILPLCLHAFVYIRVSPTASVSMQVESCMECHNKQQAPQGAVISNLLFWMCGFILFRII